MKVSSSEVLTAAESTGFRAGTVEKVIHLLNLLNALNAHPFLRNKWVLKGGTALNMFVLDLARLSVDIDLNYIGATGREEMLAERPEFEQAVRAVFSREGYIPSEKFPTNTPAENGDWATAMSRVNQALSRSISISCLDFPCGMSGNVILICSGIFGPRGFPFSIFTNWRPASWQRCWREVRQGICSIVTAFLTWRRSNEIGFARRSSLTAA